MAERTTGSHVAEVLVPLAAVTVVFGSVVALIWLATRKTSMGNIGAPARNVRVNPYTSGARAKKLSSEAFTRDDDQGYDLDVDGEDVT